MHRLTNPVKHYDWGSTTALPALLGTVPDGRPVAEVWMGAHPADPSTTETGESLDRLVGAAPEIVLGPTAAALGPRLPFLVKFLAAAAPLSLQVHPTAAQAETGFAREEAAGVPLTAPTRSYRDRSGKPELLLALAETQLLCGFRPPAEIRDVLGGLDLPVLAPLVGSLGDADPAAALRSALTLLLRTGATERLSLTTAVTGRAHERRDRRPEYRLVGELAAHHPGDVGVVAALFLNRLQVATGEVVYVAPGTIHTYLRGTGLEVMAASDNVVRAGLTTKHVDVAELLRLVNLTPGEPILVDGAPAGRGTEYLPPVPGFALWTLGCGDDDDLGEPGATAAGDVRRPRTRPGAPTPGPPAGARIVVACAGRAVVSCGSGRMELGPGESALLSHSDGAVDLSTAGLVAVAHRPVAGQNGPARRGAGNC